MVSCAPSAAGGDVLQAGGSRQRRALLARLAFPAILIAAALLHLQAARRLPTPLYLRDEGGYLANAAALAGYVFDGASSYRAGYSLLLAPFYVFFGNIFTIYRLAQGLNVALAVASLVLVYRWLVDLFPDERRSNVLLAVLVVGSYPAWTVFSTLVLSENVVIPLFVLSSVLCFRTAKFGGGYWLAWGSCAGFLDIVHPRGLIVAFAAMMVGAVIAAGRREWIRFAMFVAIIGILIAFERFLLAPWLTARLTLGEYPPDLRYPTLAELFFPLTTFSGIRAVLLHLFAHCAYVLMGTLWLSWFGVLHAARASAADIRRRSFTPQTLALAYAALALLGTIALSALHFTAYPNALQLDQWMYGRYAEAVLMPTLAVGFMVARRRDFWIAFALALAMTWIFAASARVGGANPLNVSALWQAFLLPGKPYVFWCAAAGAIALVALSLPGGALRAIVFAVVFAAAGYFVYADNFGVSYALYGKRFRLAQSIIDHVAPIPGTCVGYDEPSVIEPRTDSTLQLYENFLFRYRVRRTTVETWARDCDGPLISWSRDLDHAHPEIPFVLSEFEIGDRLTTNDGPFLWTHQGRPWFTLPLDQEVVFSGEEAPAHHMLGDGWYDIEPVGAWSGAAADLWIPVSDACSSGDGCDLKLFFAVLTNGEVPRDPVTIEAKTDDGRTARWITASRDAEWHVFRLGNVQSPSSGLRVRLSIEEAKSPQQLGISEDPRLLGILLKRALVTRSSSDAGDDASSN
jgi:hypothetical protein